MFLNNKDMVPEARFFSIDELGLLRAAQDKFPVRKRAGPSTDSGQAHRHGVKAGLNSYPFPFCRGLL